MLLRLNPGIELRETSSYVIRIDEEDLFAYHLDNRFIQAMNPRLLEHIEAPGGTPSLVTGTQEVASKVRGDTTVNHRLLYR